MKKIRKLLVLGILSCTFLPNLMSYTYAEDIQSNGVNVVSNKVDVVSKEDEEISIENEAYGKESKEEINKRYYGLAFFREDILNDSDLNITTKLMTRNDCYNTEKDINVKGIMVHSTATPGIMADIWYELWNKSYEAGEINREACVHAFLDDKGVYQYLPWNHRGWHAGGKANNTHIGFEICEPKGIIYKKGYNGIASIDVEETREYFEKIWDNSVKLCVMICRQFNLTEKDIICHCEGHSLGIASNHGDVMHWWKYYGKDMDMFREDVKKALNDFDTIQDLNLDEMEK